MAQLRFRGDERHEVPLLGRAVEPDELVEVPDDLYAEVSWPSAYWTVVAEKTAATPPKTTKSGA